MYEAVQGEAVQDLAYTQGSLLFGIRCHRWMTFCNFRVIIDFLGLNGVLPDYCLTGSNGQKMFNVAAFTIQGVEQQRRRRERLHDS